MSNRTALYDSHVQAGGKIVDFSGWQLPVHYGSLVDEHHAVRRAAGMFDVSHMTIVDIAGTQAQDFLRQLLANDVALLAPGGALYSCMLNDRGGIIDDLITYRFDSHRYRLIVNAATREKDLQWINARAGGFDVAIAERSELAMIAVQGPDAVAICLEQLPADVAELAAGLERFQACQVGGWFVARTGYTGEDGYEIAAQPDDVISLWRNLRQAGVSACGLGARDTLRLEAGMNLYGHDMDETQTPQTSGLGWTVAWQPDQRDFIGRAALQRQREHGVPTRLIGLVLQDKGVLREAQLLFDDDREVGIVTSGTFSPTLQKSIAFARLDVDSTGALSVQIRNRRLSVARSSRVFVRDGKPSASAG